MQSTPVKTITLISPSLSAGGAERVISLLANWLINEVDQVHLILLTQGPRFYDLDSRIQVHEPDFNIEELGRLKFTLKSFFWLRSLWKKLQSGAALSFGGKYNAFVLLRFSNKARGMIWVSSAATGGENGLRIRVFGTKGAIDWLQDEPNSMKYTPLNFPTLIHIWKFSNYRDVEYARSILTKVLFSVLEHYRTAT